MRVVGKGRKERVVPVGRPARQALARWVEEGRPILLQGPEGRAAGDALGERRRGVGCGGATAEPAP